MLKTILSLPRPLKAMGACMMLVLAIVSVSSAPDIQPGLGLSQDACEFIVMASGFLFMGLSLMLLVLSIFIDGE